MMENRLPRYLTGSLAFGVYFLILALLIFYFNTKTRQESTHYVKKNEERIQVALSTPEKKKSDTPQPKKQPAPKTEPKPKPVPKPKPKPAPKPKPKETVKKPVEQKKVIKEKVVKKVIKEPVKKDQNVTRPKKVNKPQSLFADITSSKPKETKKAAEKPVERKPKLDVIKVKEKSSAAELVSSSLKVQQSSDRGVENAYLAKIEEKLKGWPAQSEYAGEKARVMIEVEPSGSFTYRVLSASSIPEFNAGLDAYLKQLQRFGFGPHKGNRAYKLDVEFIATE
ncbi:MAG: TonB C-terminal domain-containing protein [Campylobacterales bacterium]|nr:TonB C-terminal domain-containing protein [Campylobacterales bacterium]